LKKFQIAIHLLEQEKKKAWKEVPVVPVAPKETVVPIEEKQDSSILLADCLPRLGFDVRALALSQHLCPFL